jgi:multidrug efflux system membrane fusion protein
VPQVTGVLQSLLFKEGQQVRSARPLAQIDPRAFQAALGQAEGTLARDKAQLDNARVDVVRYRDLLAKDGIPKQQLDTQEALVRQLEGTVKTDQSAVDNARLQLSYTRVTAPIAGRVGSQAGRPRQRGGARRRQRHRHHHADAADCARRSRCRRPTCR